MKQNKKSNNRLNCFDENYFIQSQKKRINKKARVEALLILALFIVYFIMFILSFK